MSIDIRWHWVINQNSEEQDHTCNKKCKTCGDVIFIPKCLPAKEGIRSSINCKNGHVMLEWKPFKYTVEEIDDLTTEGN